MKSIDPEVLTILQEELQEISVSLLASPPAGNEVPLDALQDYVRRLQRLAAMLRPLHQNLLLQATSLLQKNILEWLRHGVGDARHSMWKLVIEWPLEVSRYLDARGSRDATANITRFLSNADWLLPMSPDIAYQAVDASAAAPVTPPGLPTSINRGDLSLQIPPDVSQSLVVELLQELPDLTERLANSIESWVNDPSQTDKLLEARRVAHTIKGAANVVGVRGIAVFTHLLEDVLQLPVGNDAALPMLTVRAASCLQQMTDALLRRASTPPLAEAVATALLATLREAGDFSDESTTALNIADDSAESSTPDTAVLASPPPSVGLRISPLLVDDMFRLAGESSVSLHKLREILQQSRTLAQNLTRRASAATDHGHLLFPDNDTRPIAYQPGEAHLRMQDLRESIADMQLLSEDLQRQFMEIDELMTRQERLGEELRNSTRQCRMLAAADIVPRLRRTVKEAARTAGKQVLLKVIGADTMVDAHILHALIDPLMHAIRNAVDHGIESIDERRRLGKRDQAEIALSFVHEGSDVVVRCQDDGRGLDNAAIRQRAIAHRLIAANETLSDAQLARLIFEPGFSTRDVASQISGRGIGMSAIVAKIEELKGLIEIFSQPGQGCCVEFRMPESLLSIGGLLIRLNSQTVGICSRGLQRVVMLEASRINTDTATPSVEIDGQSLPVHRIEALLFGNNAPKISPAVTGQIPALVIRTGDIHAVVIVEAIVATRTLLIRRPGHYLRDYAALFGTTTLTDGGVVAVLDLVELLRAPPNWTPASLTTATSDSTEGPVAWIIDDSAAVRREISAQTAAVGYTIRMSEDAAQASVLLSLPPPALVVLDADMPGLSGLELCARMRADPRFKTTPIVILSARGDACRDAARKAGATLLLPKPCPRPVLQRMLERYPAPPRDQLALAAAAEDTPN
jgi:chemosensory pili system protein ChpA (sensor histidine kinase/response regulator)